MDEWADFPFDRGVQYKRNCGADRKHRQKVVKGAAHQKDEQLDKADQSKAFLTPAVLDFVDVLQRIVSLLDRQSVFDEIPRNGIDTGHPVQVRRAFGNPFDDRNRMHIRTVERSHQPGGQSQCFGHLQPGLLQDACHRILDTVRFRVAFKHDLSGQDRCIHV